MSGRSRIQAARQRVAGAKRALLVGAACAFAVAMGLARITHPGATATTQQPSTAEPVQFGEDDGGSDEFFGESDDDSAGGWIAPSTGAPQVRTQTS